MNTLESLNLLYNTTREMNAQADVHTKLAIAYQTVVAVLPEVIEAKNNKTEEKKEPVVTE